MIKLNLNVFSPLILLYTILILYLIIFCEYMQLFILTRLIPTLSEILSAQKLWTKILQHRIPPVWHVTIIWTLLLKCSRTFSVRYGIIPVIPHYFSLIRKIILTCRTLFVITPISVWRSHNLHTCPQFLALF